MAMLVLPDVFARTWGDARGPPTAAPRSTTRSGPRRSAASAAPPGLHLHGRGVLGPRVGRCSSRASTTPTTSGSTTPARADAGAVRDHLRADAGLPAPLGALPREPRRARAAAAFPPRGPRAAAVVTFLGARRCASSTRASSKGATCRPRLPLGRRGRPSPRRRGARAPSPGLPHLSGGPERRDRGPGVSRERAARPVGQQLDHRGCSHSVSSGRQSSLGCVGVGSTDDGGVRLVLQPLGGWARAHLFTLARSHGPDHEVYTSATAPTFAAAGSI